jgi:hypothetical protein
MELQFFFKIDKIDLDKIPRFLLSKFYKDKTQQFVCGWLYPYENNFNELTHV